MKTLSKIERIIVSFGYWLAVLIPILIGSWVCFYDGLDLYEEEALLLWVPYAGTATWWLTRKLIFRIIRICKN